MEGYQRRVVVERQELSKKTAALAEFTSDDAKFSKVRAAEQVRMLKQLNLMKDYVEVLDERIDGFKEGDDECS